MDPTAGIPIFLSFIFSSSSLAVLPFFFEHMPFFLAGAIFLGVQCVTLFKGSLKNGWRVAREKVCQNLGLVRYLWREGLTFASNTELAVVWMTSISSFCLFYLMRMMQEFPLLYLCKKNIHSSQFVQFIAIFNLVSII
jgi:hypothetical protein